MTLRKYLSGILVALVGVTFTFSDIQAAGAFGASVVSMSEGGEIIMSPGERKTVSVEFLNTGTQTWQNDGPGYVSLYTHGPKYRKSVFDPATWLWGDHPARISEAIVSPGEKASISFELHAPQETGSYSEVFHLASEDTAWIDGGKVELNIEVSSEAQEVVPAASEPVANDASGLSAELLVKSANEVNAGPGKSILFTAVFKNTGTEVWTSYGLNVPDVSIASSGVSFAHASWSNGKVLSLSGQSVAPGETAVLNFAFTTPSVNGRHTARFQLAANGATVPGADLSFPVVVTGGSAAGSVPQVSEGDPEVQTRELIPEPLVRIGVLIVDEETDNEIIVSSVESDYNIVNTDGDLLAEVEKNNLARAYYDGGVYYYEIDGALFESRDPIKFVSENHAALRVVNWDKRITRGTKHADNEFRHVLELRHNDYKDRVWLINEVPMDYYLRGLAETSEIDPLDMNMAQITAARSYAYWHVLNGGKRPKEFMDLNSTPADQYYLGYGREKRASNIVEAVEATRGYVVLYEDEVALTSYYARSNGSTKNWSQVWWGDRPYAKAVSVPCDAGKTQWGHGVGMPQSGAKCMAEDGDSWTDILTYFYTGVTVDRLWE